MVDHIKPDYSSCVTDELQINRNQFWQAAWIWIQKPHIVNRRLFGVKTLETYFVPDSTSSKLDTIGTLRAVPHNSFTTADAYFVDHLGLRVEKDVWRVSENSSYLVVRKLLSRKRNLDDSYELCYMNYPSNEVVHVEVVKCANRRLSASFALKLHNNRVSIQILENSVGTSCEWLNHLLLPKLVKWAGEFEPDAVRQNSNTAGSLRLVNCDDYNELYACLKKKYGKEIVEKWPENTDPLKFVYEDIAIATYLCLIWKDEKVNFVDLGCGNGLLVHILSNEGFKGFGLDIRARKVWSLFCDTDLRVGTVTPDEHSTFPEVDWIIGNHSDELTPWIPVFASRSSYTCKFFLLPCCAYNFNGRKYQRRNSNVSIYSDYVEYVQSVCTELGFKTEVDRLRIPSTKRICILGYGRLYENGEYESFTCETIPKVIKSSSAEVDFTPRAAVERVRNCTQIDKNVTKKVVDTITRALIDKLLLERRKQQQQQSSVEDPWAIGCCFAIKDAVLLLGENDLKQLKNECGGLQTLLKNHHSIFLVCNGKIYFRKPVEKDSSRISNWKKAPCWFFHNHPFSCPLPENKCSFIH